MASGAGRWQRLRARAGTVRVRSTVAAVLMVGAALTVGAVIGTVLLVNTLRNGLTQQTHAAAESRAAEVTAILESGRRPLTLPVSSRDEQLVQVLDASGAVLAASSNVAGRPAVARLRPGESAEVATPLDNDKFVAVAMAANAPEGQLTVIVAQAPVGVQLSQAVTRLLIIGLPLLLILVGYVTWRAVGRALAPVEAIRGEVDEISAAELHRRVPQPSGKDEIAYLAATMNRMLGRLEQAQASQRRFVSDASHELRSPVASIRQHAEVALAHPGSTSVAALAQTVLAENLRVQRLVDDLLLLAKVDEYILQLRRQPIDLDDLVFDEAGRLRATGSLRIDTTRVSAGRVAGDLSGLRRVLRNLSDNAAGHARTRIEFALSERDGAVVFTIDDDGPGIPENERQRVFERFVRLDDARARHDGGTGLGLAIVAELVSAHGGTVTITGSGLGGARVEVILPRQP